MFEDKIQKIDMGVLPLTPRLWVRCPKEMLILFTQDESDDLINIHPWV